MFADVEQRSVPLVVSGVDLGRRVLCIQGLEGDVVVLDRQRDQFVDIDYSLCF